MAKISSFLTIVFLGALSSISALFAQDGQPAPKNYNLKIAFEFGLDGMSGTLKKPEQIRENYSLAYSGGDGYYDYGYFRESSLLRTLYFGVKPEFFVYRNRLGIASGLRIYATSSELASSGNNFLWRVSEDASNTGYVQIKNIRHSSYLLAIPLEIRVFPNRRELPFQHYFKVGTSLNYRIHSKNQVNFVNNAMEKYDGLIQSQLSDNKIFSAFIYGALGFKIGEYKEGRWIPWINVEFIFPQGLLTENSFTFVENGAFGAGFQLSFQIPIGKNVRIGAK